MVSIVSLVSVGGSVWLKSVGYCLTLESRLLNLGVILVYGPVLTISNQSSYLFSKGFDVFP